MPWWERLRLRRLHKEPLYAASSARFDQLLREIGLARSLATNRLVCKFCRTVITEASEIAAVFPESGAVKAVCDDPACMRQLAAYIAEGRLRTQS